MNSASVRWTVSGRKASPTMKGTEIALIWPMVIIGRLALRDDTPAM